GIDGNPAFGIDGEQLITGANKGPGGCAITGGKYASLSAVPSWAKNTLYAKNSFIIDSNGNLEQTLTGGKSGGTEPFSWPSTISSTTPDNTVEWTLVEVGDVCPAAHEKEFITTNEILI